LKHWSNVCRRRGRRFRVLDSVHSSFKHMRLNGNGNLAQFDHAVFGRVVWLFDYNALLLNRFRPILLEDAFANPFLP